MRTLAILSILILPCSALAETPNFFVPLPSTPTPIGNTTQPVGMSAATDAPLPSFSDNKSVFDMLEVVGRSDTHATLRYPQMGLATPGANLQAGQQGNMASGAGAAIGAMNYRVMSVKQGGVILLNGRKYFVLLNKDDETVRLLDSSKKNIVWEGDLSAPKSYSVSPNLADHQYAPPMSAGAGVSVEGSSTLSQQPNANQGTIPR